MASSQPPLAYEKALSSDLTIERKSARWSLDYNCLGVYNEAQALLAASGQAPPLISAGAFELGISRQRVKQLGPDAFVVTFDYEPLDQDDEKNQAPPDPGTWKFSWNTAGGTHKITQAKKDSETSYPASGTATKLGGIIGWDGKKINGTEIVVPKLEFSITRYYAPADVNMTLVKNLARATGKINQSAWLGFDAQEVLFLGSRGDADLATVRNQRTKPVSVQLDFAASENTTNIKYWVDEQAGSSITVASKKGWQYLWVRYEQKADASTKVVKAVPVCVYVDDVYDQIDFSALFGFG